MSAIGSGDITYALQSQRKEESGMRYYTYKLTFGDGALTYPSGGLPLLAGKLGVPNSIKSLTVYAPDSSNGFMYKYDVTNNKIRIYQAPVQSHTHDILLKNAAVADGASARVNAGANLLGANTGGDLTVTGGGANGGVVTTVLAAAALSELGGAAAPAATNIYVEVVGW